MVVGPGGGRRAWPCRAVVGGVGRAGHDTWVAGSLDDVVVAAGACPGVVAAVAVPRVLGPNTLKITSNTKPLQVSTKPLRLQCLHDNIQNY